jgi:hypothetical protein
MATDTKRGIVAGYSAAVGGASRKTWSGDKYQRNGKESEKSGFHVHLLMLKHTNA